MPQSAAYKKHLADQAKSKGTDTGSPEGRGTESSQASATAVQEAPAADDKIVLTVTATETVNWLQLRSGVHPIPLELIMEDPENARKQFDAEALRSLAASIAEDGGVNIEAAIVRPLSQANVEDMTALGGLPVPLFVLLSGHRRFRAQQINGAKFLKCEIQELVDDDAAFKRALLCNLQREDLSPIEKGQAFGKLMDGRRYVSVEAMAKALGMPEHARSIRDLMSLSNLNAAAAAALIDKRIFLSHAVLIAREKLEDQMKVLEACFRPQAVDNGGGMEMVPTLISEKALRDWIKEFHEANAPKQPDMFETEDEAAEREGKYLEDQADEILDRVGAGTGDGVGSGAGDSNPPVREETPAQAKDDSDIDDDDLTPAQREAVKPEEGPYAKEREAREEKLRKLTGLIRFPYPIAVYKLLAVELSQRMSKEDCTAAGRAMRIDKPMFDWAMEHDEHKMEDMQSCAKLVIALLLACECNPNNVPLRIDALLNQLEGWKNDDEANADGAKSAMSRLSRKLKAKAKAPSPAQVSKVMKAEKAKLANKKTETKAFKKFIADKSKPKAKSSKKR